MLEQDPERLHGAWSQPDISAVAGEPAGVGVQAKRTECQLGHRTLFRSDPRNAVSRLHTSCRLNNAVAEACHGPSPLIATLCCT